MEEGNDWWEEVERKSSLGGYRMKFGLELTLGAQGQEPVRYQFRMRSDTAGLFADKKRCGVWRIDVCCVIGREQVEDMLHLLVIYEECEWEGLELLKRTGDIEGSDVWLEKLIYLGR